VITNETRVTDEEISRLASQWSTAPVEPEARLEPALSVLGAERLSELDHFDQVQLSEVIAVCRACESISAAGRVLLDKSRVRRQSTNDSDRLRKYLQRFGVSRADIVATVGVSSDPA